MFDWLWSRFHRRESLRQPSDDDGRQSVRSSEARIRRQTPFEMAVAKMAADPDGGAGRVRAVSLSDFRDSVGDKWPRLADKVAIIADNLIRRHLGAGNCFQRQGEDVWLLAFPNSTADEARRVATVVAQEISRHLLGERCVGGERPLAVAACLQARAALDDDGRVDDCAIRRSLSETEAFVDHLTAAEAVEDPGWQRMPAPVHKNKSAPPWTPLVVRKETSTADKWQAVGPLTADSRLSLLWRPTWVAENEAISAYCARVIRVDATGAAPLEGPQAYPRDDSVSAVSIDRFVLAGALRGLDSALRTGRGGSVIVPMSWESLQAGHRAEFLPLFAELAPDIRDQRLGIEVFRIPDDVSGDNLADVAGFLNGLCGQVLLRLRLSSDLLCRVHELDGAKVGLDLSELRPEERMNDDRLLKTLETLQASADRAGSGCYLWSARRRRVVGGVVSGGFDMVNGPGLMKDVGRPAQVVPAPRQRFALAG